MIETSTFLIVTGSWLMPSTQAVSHGAGHSRPVNSGKLLVACSRSIAPSQSSRQTRSFHSGMMLPSGQPWWQNGMPQSMQRPACVLDDRQQRAAEAAGVDLVPVLDALLDRRRSATSRPCFRKPFGSAMQHLHDPRALGLVLVEALLERPRPSRASSTRL